MLSPDWKSYFVLLSLWSDPEYWARRIRRKWNRLVRGAPAPGGASIGPGAHARSVRPGTAAAATPPAKHPANRPPSDLPVDLVYLWVSGQDPAHREKRNYWLQRHGLDPVVFNPDVRYVEDDELKYSLRSAELFLPWIRRVFLVTDNQVPEWLDRANPRVRVVDHTEFVSEPEWLPTFNSKAIAAQLHNIEELSEHFLCCNDDTFFGAPCQPEDFFAVLPDGRVTMKVMLSESDDDWIIPAHWIEHDPLARLWMAGWNNLKVTLEARRPWRKVRHLSIHQAEAMTRSALRDTAQKFASDYRRTCASRFRNKDDINFIALTNYRCLAAKTAVRGMLPHRVFARESDLDAYTRAELPTLFCVNGGPDETELTRERALQRLFPEPSSFERVRAPAARRETPPLASERAP